MFFGKHYIMTFDKENGGHIQSYGSYMNFGRVAANYSSLIAHVEHLKEMDNINIIVIEDGQEKKAYFYKLFAFSDLNCIAFVEIGDGAKGFLDLQNKLSIDAMTGLYNRKHLDEQLKKASSSIPSGAIFTFMMIDIDNFKSINDTYGHDCGDIVIKSISTALKNSVRSSDTVARYGGEEFSIILRNTGLTSAELVADKIINTIHGINIQYGDISFGVTASIGMFTADAFCSLTDEEIVKKADTALYLAKKAGKDRYVYEL